MRTRGFEVVSRLDEDKVRLPEVSTAKSAGYDFFAAETVEIAPSLRVFRETNSGKWAWEFKPTMVKTGIKAYMQDDEALFLYNRSSAPKKLGLILSNGVGVVDSDYYDNPDNEGEIGFMFYNVLPFSVTLRAGEKIGQGVFQKFLRSDTHSFSEGATKSRLGGYGSTGK